MKPPLGECLEATARAFARALLPASFRERLRARRRADARAHAAARGVKDVFREIYASNAWGGAPGELCSGSGSAPEYAAPYAAAVNAFVERNEIRTIVDLGCGDFSVGRLLARPGVRYLGVDVVDEVVARNRERFGSREIEFVCLDVTADVLPEGDVCLLRQVLQHLSNAEILAVLERTRRYRFVLVTEHLPPAGASARPNVDKPHGADTRLVDGSGVFLEEEPFRRKIVEVLLDLPVRPPLRDPGERLVTFRIL